MYCSLCKKEASLYFGICKECRDYDGLQKIMKEKMKQIKDKQK